MDILPPQFIENNYMKYIPVKTGKKCVNIFSLTLVGILRNVRIHSNNKHIRICTYIHIHIYLFYCFFSINVILHYKEVLLDAKYQTLKLNNDITMM